MQFQNYVNIVTSDRGWILEKLAREITSRLPYVRYGAVPAPDAYMQYYITYSARKQRISPVELGWFAHQERIPATAQLFEDIARDVDMCLCQAEIYADVIRDLGVSNVEILSPGVDGDHFTPVVKVGVVGRTYHTGRKGEALVDAVRDVAGIEWHFTGDGWPGPAEHVPGDRMADFYNAMDYILVPALFEGGPMCVVEAVACGVPVIAPAIGWVHHFPHIAYETGNADDLHRVLSGIVGERARDRDAAIARSWDNWADQHDRIFRRLFAQAGRAPDATAMPVHAGVGSVAVTLHGNEGKALGGPSVRVPELVRRLAPMGIDARLYRMPDKAALDADIVHNFNVWSPISSLAVNRRVKEAGKQLVFSPIYLELSDTRLWQNEIPALFDQDLAPEQLNLALAEAIATSAARRETELLVPEPLPGYHAMVREMVDLADHVVFLSEVERKAMARIGAVPKASSIVPNPVHAAAFTHGTPDLFLDTYGIRDFVLCVARVEPRKNQLMLMHALRDTGIPLVIVGGETNPAYSALLDKHMRDNVHRLGRIEPQSPLLASAMAAARVVTLPSWSEGAPLAALEAAAAGANLVLSNRSGEQEYIGDFARYCDPADLDSIRNAIVEAYEAGRSEEERQRQKDHIAQEFSWTRHAERTIAVYQSVSDAARASAAVAPPRRALPAAPMIVFDLTTSANHNGRPTGIMRAEMSLACALLDRHGDNILFIAWHDSQQRYVDIPGEAVRSGRIAQAREAVRTSDPVELKVEPGARMIVAGSAWMQSDRYLPGVRNFVRNHDAALTAIIHDFIPMAAPQWFPAGYAAKFRRNAKQFLEMCGHVVAVSDHTRKDVLAFAHANDIFIPEPHVYRQGDGLVEAVANEAIFRESGIDAKNFILSVGAVHPRKNQRMLLDIWRRLRQDMGTKCPQLVIVGGVAWDGHDVHRLIQEDPLLAGRVKLLSDVGDDHLAALYEHCLLTVYPSLYEGWGLPVAESLARGRICLAADATSVPEIAPDVTDLIDPIDTAAWLGRIKFYALSGSAREAREAQIKAAFQPQDWNQAAGQLLDIFRAVAEPVTDGHYIPGHYIGMDAGYSLRSLRLSGWHGAEDWGRWSRDKVASLSVALRSPLGADHVLRVTLRAVSPAGRSGTNCTIRCNGAEVGMVRFVRAQEVTTYLHVPAALLDGHGRLELEFEAVQTVALANASVRGREPFVIGIGVTSLSLFPASVVALPEDWIGAPAWLLTQSGYQQVRHLDLSAVVEEPEPQEEDVATLVQDAALEGDESDPATPEDDLAVPAEAEAPSARPADEREAPLVVAADMPSGQDSPSEEAEPEQDEQPVPIFDIRLPQAYRSAHTAEELMGLPDEDFIYCAYWTIFGRAADPDGFGYFRSKLRSGMSKADVLLLLSRSDEGRAHGMHLPDLRLLLERQALARHPLLGFHYRRLYKIAKDDAATRERNLIENQVLANAAENIRRLAHLEALLAQERDDAGTTH